MVQKSENKGENGGKIGWSSKRPYRETLRPLRRFEMLKREHPTTHQVSTNSTLNTKLHNPPLVFYLDSIAFHCITRLWRQAIITHSEDSLPISNS